MGLRAFWKGKASAAASTSPRQTARLYEFENRYFVSTVRWIAEIGKPTILSVDSTDEVLGEAVLRHLAEFDPSGLEIKNRKASDWPAYVASGAKSMRAFERELWHCDLQRSGHTFEVWARPRRTLKEGLSAHCSSRCHDPSLVGDAVRVAIKAAKAMRDGGAI